MPERAKTTPATETIQSAKSAVEGQLRQYQPPESDRTAHFNGDMLEYLTAVSLGADPDVLPLHRYLPVEIYMARDLTEGEPDLFLATSNLIGDDGFQTLFEIHSVGSTEIGSFRLTFVLRSLERLTLQAIRELIEEIKVISERLKSLSADAPEQQPEPHSAAALRDAQTEVAKAQAEVAKAQTELAKAQAEVAKAQTEATSELARAQADEARANAELARLQGDEARAHTTLAKVKMVLAVATFCVAALGGAEAGYIQWAHLRAEKPTPASGVTVYITQPSVAFTVPGYHPSSGTPPGQTEK